MTDAQRRLLEVFVREAVARDLDAVAAEVRELQSEVRALRREAGRPPLPMSPAERRDAVLELRRRGHSVPRIATHLGISKSTAARDAQQLGAPRATRGPYRPHGLDGRPSSARDAANA